jgi:hypothetical protein
VEGENGAREKILHHETGERHEIKRVHAKARSRKGFEK